MPRKKQTEPEICREAESRIQSIEQTLEVGHFKDANYPSRFDKNESAIEDLNTKYNIAFGGVLGIQLLFGVFVAVFEMTRKG